MAALLVGAWTGNPRRTRVPAQGLFRRHSFRLFVAFLTLSALSLFFFQTLVRDFVAQRLVSETETEALRIAAIARKSLGDLSAFQEAEVPGPLAISDAAISWVAALVAPGKPGWVGLDGQACLFHLQSRRSPGPRRRGYTDRVKVSSQRRRALGRIAVLGLYALVALVAPLLHHDFECHLNSRVHCDACTASPAASKFDSAVVVFGLVAPLRPRVPANRTAEGSAERPASPGRAPPAKSPLV